MPDDQEMLKILSATSSAAHQIKILSALCQDYCDEPPDQMYLLEIIEEKSQFIKTSNKKITQYLEFGKSLK